jgi:hypothetical protein
VAFAGTRDAKKVDNNPQAFAAKVDIRRRVLAGVGTRDARVFDGFAGAGELYAAVWKDAAAYTGCDLKYQPMRGDVRLMFAADNRRVLRSLDLSAFNVFDLDAYGSPWEQALIVAARRKVAAGERIGFTITEGGGIPYKANIVPAPVAILARLKPGIVGLNRKMETIVERCLIGVAQRMNCTIEKRWQARGKTGAAMVYVGAVMVGA